MQVGNLRERGLRVVHAVLQRVLNLLLPLDLFFDLLELLVELIGFGLLGLRDVAFLDGGIIWPRQVADVVEDKAQQPDEKQREQHAEKTDRRPKRERRTVLLGLFRISGSFAGRLAGLYKKCLMYFRNLTVCSVMRLSH